MSEPFANRVQRWMNEREIYQAELVIRGPKLIESLMTQMSLRSIARFSKLSPTYLSLVLNRKSVISPGAFIKLYEVQKNGGRIRE